MKRIIFNFMIAGCFLSSCAEKPAEKRLFEHIVVIGVDGLTSEGLKRAATPVMDELIANGAVTYNTRTVLPTVSAPNWGAMIHGAGPESTGITSNSWRSGDEQWLQPIVKNKAGRFPGIFNVIREQLPEAEQGAIFHWGGFGHLVQEDVVNRYNTYDSEDETTRQVCDYIVAKKPVFLFIQLDHVDHAGHSSVYNSDVYLQSVEKTDTLVGRIMESIRQAGMENNTLVMIVSDHGGINTGHGGVSTDEANVPVIYYGNGVKKNYKVQQTVYMYDVAANVAFALKLKAPQAWIGRPTLSAFEGYQEAE